MGEDHRSKVEAERRAKEMARKVLNTPSKPKKNLRGKKADPKAADARTRKKVT